MVKVVLPVGRLEGQRLEPDVGGIDAVFGIKARVAFPQFAREPAAGGSKSPQPPP